MSITISRERTGLASAGLRLRRREEWGSKFNYATPQPSGDPWPGRYRAVDEPANRIFVHITVTNPGNYSSDDAHARAVEAIGKARFPNTGVSYNRLIMLSGRLYEAQPIGRRGAHTVNDKQVGTCSTSGCPSKGRTVTAPGRSYNLNYNARAYAVCGNVGDPISDKVIDGVARCIAGDMLAGFVSKSAPIHGHRCVAWKDCPGGKVWAVMAKIAARVSYYLSHGLAPTPTPAPAPEEDFMGYIDNRAELAAEMGAVLDGYFQDRLKPGEANPLAGKPDSMHPVKRAFASAPWHQPLGRNTGYDADHPLVNMHTVMGEIHVLYKQLPELLAEAGDEVGLTPEQIESLSAAVAAKVERVTVITSTGE